jgi:Fe-Mn family superoxide dismutase
MKPTYAMSIVSRRAVLLSMSGAGAALVTGCAARAEGAPQAPAGPATPPSRPAGPATPPPGGAPPAAAGGHAVKPLPFRPDGLKGLSERMIVSHHENNYGGAVKNLNRVEGELARVTKDTPSFVVGGLKQSELVYRNSATLHELYFGNLGGDGRASGAAQALIAQAYGGFGRWEELFRTTGASLGGGSGWVVLAYDLHRDALATFWSGNHSQAQVASAPLLVMDMYEHAYQIDYGADAAKYIDAFFVNLQWDEVNRRLERARRAAAALRG